MTPSIPARLGRSMILVTLALLVVVAPGSSSQVEAQTEQYLDRVSGCASVGTIGVYSSHSNSQVCDFGFFACVDTNPAAPQFAFSDVVPPTTIGMILMPYGADWHLTGGNNGYVENVCNGRAQIANVVTMLANINRDEAYRPFPEQLALIQGLCGGQCRAEFFSLSNVPIRLLNVLGAADHLVVIRDGGLDSMPVEKLMVQYLLTFGPIMRDGVAMGANGYSQDIVRVIENEGKTGWYALAQGYVQSETSAANLTADGLRIGFRIIALLFL